MHGHYILATAGHIDHGKSALVRALTGTDPDRLPEEKARGITIDLGFAHLTLPSPGGSDPVDHPPDSEPRSSVFELGIIDVPGHEDFVKNMVAGVGSIDLALLVVAADDGWMPQTEEHLQILDYLGVQHGVVALTKADLVSDVSGQIDEVRRRLQSSSLAGARIIPTSITTGLGLPELKEALIETLAGTPASRDIGKPRLNVDRVFVVRGAGTVVTGTLTGGSLSRGQTVILQPSQRTARIRGMQSHNRELERVGPGMRVALNLADVDAATEIARGHTITQAGLGESAQTLDVVVRKSERLRDLKTTAARRLKDGTLLRIHLGSRNGAAQLRLAGAEPLGPGQQVVAQLRLESPLFAFVGDHFIIRDWSEQTTLAGGTILDLDAPRRGFLRPPRQAFLRGCEEGIDSARKLLGAQIAYRTAVSRKGMLVRSHFSASELEDAIQTLSDTGEITITETSAVIRERWESWQQQLLEVLAAHHRLHPEQPGLPLTDLKASWVDQARYPAVWDDLLNDLKKGEIVVQGVVAHQRDFRPALPSDLQAEGTRLRKVLAASGLDVASRKTMAPDPKSRQALGYLINNGEAIEVAPELVLGLAAWNQARMTLRRLLRERGRATASEVRQALGVSRRIVIPLLEKFDAIGFTRREGDHRLLREE